MIGLQGSKTPKLFGTAGIRGSIKDKVTERLALDLARAMSTMLANEGEVVIGSDHRTTSAELRATLLGGLMGGGIDAVEAGFVPTPVLAFGVRDRGAEAGIMVTASHNPPQDNGMKCYTHEGREYIPEEEAILERLIAQHQFTSIAWDKMGSLGTAPDMTNSYFERLLDRLEPFRRKLKVVIDCSNGTTYNLTPLALSRMGCQVISLNSHPDGTFPGRPAEPNPANLVATCQFVRTVKADLGIAHDGDGDRLAVIDEKGRYINNDTLLAFIARLLLMEHGPGRVVTTVDTSSRIDKIVTSSGGTVERTKLGKTHVMLSQDDRESIRLCCEPWKIIDPAWGSWGDAIYAACLVAQALDRSKGSASDLFSGIPAYPQERFFFPCPDELKDDAVMRISQAMAAERNIKEIATLDGIRVDFKDNSWVLIRKSGTEPKIRVYCEGRSSRRLRQLVSTSSSLVKKAIRTAQRSRTKPA
jgi:phosphoglucosamine mutase